jgi:threonine dehydrogenase-like Zn-dependent dehydrogenase
MPLPVNLGHEIAGVVIEAGSDCPIRPGTRVAVDPTIGCVVRGIDPPCAKCAAGMPSVCRNMGSKVLTPGFLLGYTQGLGGGWSEQVVAHASMLHPLPEGLPDEIATLHEPLSIAVHGLLRQPPRKGDPVLVAGAGIIGLSTIAAVRALFPESDVVAIAKHDHQAAAAEALGATRIVKVDPSGAHIEELARISGTRVLGQGSDAILAGGFPYVVEAVGTPQAVTQALRLVDGRGTVLLLGIPGLVDVDLTPVWLKEVALVGGLFHASDPGPHDGRIAHSIDRALEILAAGAPRFERLVTHEFRLEEYREALDTAYSRGAARAIKVVFRAEGER